MLLSRLDATVQLLAVANRGLETGGGSQLIGLLGWRDHSANFVPQRPRPFMRQ